MPGAPVWALIPGAPLWVLRSPLRVLNAAWREAFTPVRLLPAASLRAVATRPATRMRRRCCVAPPVRAPLCMPSPSPATDARLSGPPPIADAGVAGDGCRCTALHHPQTGTAGCAGVGQFAWCRRCSRICGGRTCSDRPRKSCRRPTFVMEVTQSRSVALPAAEHASGPLLCGLRDVSQAWASSPPGLCQTARGPSMRPWRRARVPWSRQTDGS
jgi:hypothetical protein